MNNTTHEGQVDHRHFNEQPYKVKLIRGMNGNYGWEVSVQGSDRGAMMQSVARIDNSLRMAYGPVENKEVKE